MRAACVCLLIASHSFAQVPAAARRNPFQELFSAYWTAKAEGRYEESVAKRTEIQKYVETMDASTDEYGMAVQQLANLYRNGGFTLKSQALLETAIKRAAGNQSATLLLTGDLAQHFIADGQMLKAAAALESALPLAETAAAAPGPSAGSAVVYANRSGMPAMRMATRGGMVGSRFLRATPIYQQLAMVYRMLGRSEAAQAMTDRLQRASADNPMQFASLLMQEGKFDEAAEAYRKLAGTGPENMRPMAWQSLSALYQQQQKYGEAVQALQAGIEAAKAAAGPNLNGSPALWMSQAIPHLMYLAGNQEAADAAAAQVMEQMRGRGNDGPPHGAETWYAHYLTQTKRAQQAEQFLLDYLAPRTGLSPQENLSAYYALSNAAMAAGQPERAQQYQRKAMEIQAANEPEARTPAADRVMQQAHSALAAGRYDEAYQMVMDAITRASAMPNRTSVAHGIHSIATQLRHHKMEDRAMELFVLALDRVRGWGEEDASAYITLAQSYAQFLLTSPGARDKQSLPAALDQWRDALLAARGPESGHLESVYTAYMDMERDRGDLGRAVQFANTVLSHVEGLSGKTGEAYLRAAERTAPLFEQAGDAGRAIALHKHIIANAGQSGHPNDVRPAMLTMNAAVGLSRLQQHEEAESAGAAALKMAVGKPHFADDGLKSQFAQIQEMRRQHLDRQRRQQ